MCAVGLTASAIAQPNGGQTRSDQSNNASEERYVVVTGSLIPRKVKIRHGVPATADNVRIYSHDELEATGRANTADQLATRDPSVFVRHR
jgi:hypothetical protein